MPNPTTAAEWARYVYDSCAHRDFTYANCGPCSACWEKALDAYARQQVEASRNPLYDALCKNLIGKILDRGSPADPMMDIALRLEATLRDRDLARQQVEAAQLDWSCPLCHCCGEKRHDEGDPCVSCATAVEAATLEERQRIVVYLRGTLGNNHPNLADAYEHAAKNIEAGAAAIRTLTP